MNIKKILLRIAGKDDFELDKQISTSYLVYVCKRYAFMLIRGKINSFGKNNIDRNVFIGRNVRILEKKSVHIAKQCRINDNVFIDALTQEDGGVFLGEKVALGRGSRIECTGSLRSVGKGIKIGDRSTFGNDCFFGAAGGIDIGSDVVAGQYIRFHSENHNYADINMLIKDQGVTHEGIKIGNNCWIGSGAVFLDGAELEDGCVVAANSVVNKKFEKNSVIGGVPAKLIKVRGTTNDV